MRNILVIGEEAKIEEISSEITEILETVFSIACLPSKHWDGPGILFYWGCFQNFNNMVKLIDRMYTWWGKEVKG